MLKRCTSSLDDVRPCMVSTGVGAFSLSRKPGRPCRLAPSRSAPSGPAGKPPILQAALARSRGRLAPAPALGLPKHSARLRPAHGLARCACQRLSLRKVVAHACATREPRQGSACGLGFATLSRLPHRYGVNPQRPAARPGELNTLQTPHGVRGTARNSPGRAGWPGLWRGRGRRWRRRCRRGLDELMAPAAPVRNDPRGCRNLPARGKGHARRGWVCSLLMFAYAIDSEAGKVQNTYMVDNASTPRAGRLPGSVLGDSSWLLPHRCAKSVARD